METRSPYIIIYHTEITEKIGHCPSFFLCDLCTLTKDLFEDWKGHCTRREGGHAIALSQRSRRGRRSTLFNN